MVGLFILAMLNPDSPANIVAVDGVDVVLHDLVTHSLGHPRGDVTQVVNDTGLHRWSQCVFLGNVFSPHS